MRLINASELRELLPMVACVDAMERAMRAVSGGAVVMPQRVFLPVSGEDGAAVLGLMPASAAALAAYGTKIISIHPQNPAAGRPAIQGFVALFDRDSGVPLALMDAAELTAIRTAAASALATRSLARESARSCGIFGCGVQAESHVEAMRAVRPIDEVRVWARDPARARAFAERQSENQGIAVRAVGDPAVAAACDIVCTVTASEEPVLRGEWVRPGCHVNLVGAHSLYCREADTALITAARLFADSLAACRAEAGDYMIPVHEGAIRESHILGEIGQVLDGEVPGRTEPGDITVYKSVGVAAQDLYAARVAYDRALQAGAGTSFDF